MEIRIIKFLIRKLLQLLHPFNVLEIITWNLYYLLPFWHIAVAV
jgi:hypothetical protein